MMILRYKSNVTRNIYVLNNSLFYERKKDCGCDFACKAILTLNNCKVYL